MEDINLAWNISATIHNNVILEYYLAVKEGIHVKLEVKSIPDEKNSMKSLVD